PTPAPAEPPKAPEAVSPPPTPAQPAVAEEPKAQAGTSAQQPNAGSPTPITVDIKEESSQDAAASSAVTPNLAQALEEEEKAVQEKIDSFEKKDPTLVAQPTVQEQATTNSTPPADNIPEEKPAD